MRLRRRKEEGGESPPYVAPRARSPSPMTLAAEYKNGRGASDLSAATLESLERQRRSMAEITTLANRARLARDTARRNRGEREERSRSRSRSRQGRPERQHRGEGGARRCKAATTWSPPSEGAAETMVAASASASASISSASSSSSAPERSTAAQRNSGDQSGAHECWTCHEIVEGNHVKRDPVRCRSPHVCRRAETGGCGSQIGDSSRSVTPERPPADQQNLDRCTKLMEKERERMKEVWERLRKEQTALMKARDGL